MTHPDLKKVFLGALIVLASFDVTAQAAPEGQLKAVTSDGRQVLLNNDRTWTFVESAVGDPSRSAVLSVVNVREMHDACGLDFRLQNNFGARISSLVPRIAVYNKAGVLFDSQSLSFASIKPTEDKYTKIQFTGIGCADIGNLKVSDAQHCRMGDIDMFNEEEGECLSHVYVEPSQQINISK
jgi:hypothetical protein